MKRWLAYAIVTCAIAGLVLALVSLGSTFVGSSTYTWSLPVEEVTLRQWRSPGATGDAAALVLDDTNKVKLVEIGKTKYRAAGGFKTINPLATDDRTRCGLLIQKMARETNQIRLALLPSEPGLKCESQAKLVTPTGTWNPNVTDGEDVTVQREPNDKFLAFLSKPYEASSLILVPSDGLTLEEHDQKCVAAPQSSVILFGQELRLSRAELGERGLAITVEAQGKIQAKVGSYCEMSLGERAPGSLLQSLSVLMTACTTALGLLVLILEYDLLPKKRRQPSPVPPSPVPPSPVPPSPVPQPEGEADASG